MTIQDVGVMYGLDYVQPGPGGDGVGPTYTNWDKSSITVCNCDAGFFGPDCSRIMCPKTDDPVSINQSPRAVELTIESHNGGALSGDVVVFFNGYYAAFGADASSMSARKCEKAWESLENVEDVTCKMSTTAAGAKYNVSFESWPVVPRENNLFSHTGNPPIESFTCDISAVSVAGGGAMTCNMTDVVSTHVPEYAFCGNRGRRVAASRAACAVARK